MHYKVYYTYLVLLLTCHKITTNPVIVKKVLNNGLTVIIKKTDNLQPVCIQLWYNVGAKHEQKSGFNGIAHWLEHMTFKGTNNLLSESDIPMITHKLSGYVNAATSFDWTYYTFEMPINCWQESLPLLADCMRNCTFKEDILNAELKVVIEELKMNRDNHKRSLMQKLITTIFADHPYHHPIIGYKHDLWNLSRTNMLEFYQKHYIPNNAVLVIVGNIDTDDAFNHVNSNFKNITPDYSYKQPEFHLTRDIQTHSIKLYRDIQQPYTILAFLMPGIKKNPNTYLYELLELLLTRGRQSRLTKKLIEKKNLVSSIHSFNLDLFDHDLFMIGFKPKNTTDNGKIIDLINREIAKLYETLSHDDLKKISKIVQHDYYHFLEDNNNQAMTLGQNHLAHIENDLPETIDDYDTVKSLLKEIIANYLRPTQMHKGFLLPLPATERAEWAYIKQKEIQEDTSILNNKIRISEVEEGNYVHSIKEYNAPIPEIPIPKKIVLSNGIKTFYHHDASLPLISLILNLKAGPEYDSQRQPGLYAMTCNYLQEGTKNLTAKQLSAELESNAIYLSIMPGTIIIDILKDDLPKALFIMQEIVSNATFDEKSLSKIKGLALANYYSFMDNPQARAYEIIKKHIYDKHPFSTSAYMNKEIIDSVVRDDIMQFYKKYFSPDEAQLAIVGDLSNYDIPTLLNDTLAHWNGEKIDDLVFPELKPTKEAIITEYINQDQVVLQFAGLSIPRTHQDFDKLLIFDHIFCKGMNSHLFKLREKHGAFYTISGSLVSGSSLQPGLVYIHTIVSRERVQEVITLLKNAINDATHTITQEELYAAKRIIINTMYNAYTTNYMRAQSFLFFEQYKLDDNYFKTRKEFIESLTIEDIRQAVEKILRTDSMIIVQAGNL